MSLHTQNVADQNVERLLSAYRPEALDPGFVQETKDKLLAAARELAEARKRALALPAQAPEYTRLRRRLGWAMGLAAALACAYLIQRANQPRPSTIPVKKQDLSVLAAKREMLLAELAAARSERTVGLTPKARPALAAIKPVKVGETIVTGAGERRRAVLEDGSVLYVNGGSEVRHVGPRKVELSRGEVYVEVAPREAGSEATFVVATPSREVSALGTRFAVRADAKGSGVLVTQGKVRVSDLDRALTTGEQLITGSTRIETAPRATHELDWTKDLMAAAESPLVPCARHGGGVLLAIDPFGQEVKLTMRKFHIDVHIEDGFARTTIDQTYFNNETGRLEGTFYFPLPPDASLSRLAMYVEDGADSKLNEGGMAEKTHASNVYQTIRDQRRDPALLEWVDGSTFKMRVFPLEGRKEKRIILSYTQRLSSLYGTYRYRFPTGHTMELVRDWSFEARVKHGAEQRITSPSHPEEMKIEPKGGDMVLTAAAKNTKPQKDVVLEILDKTDDRDLARFSTSVHENHQYLMLRYRPELKAETKLQRRDWVVLFEAGANRDPLIARTQIEVVKNLLEAAEHEDTFCLMTANTRVHLFDKKPRPLNQKNIDEAIAWLEGCHLIGALDLNQALESAEPLLKLGTNPHLVHVGAGVPALGERGDSILAGRVPEGARYVGIGVGKKWNRAFMKMAAERSGGFFTQINPDEPIGWKTFDLLATLNTPRLMGVTVEEVGKKAVFLTEALALAQGEEICAITRVDAGKKETLPEVVVLNGTLNGKPWTRKLEVVHAIPGADYLPRTWAKQEIDRLLTVGAEVNKEAITQLSMKMYVMSPFTSLLVLETEEDYAKFKVDRGRKDHWAMYAAPDRMPTVFEPDPLRQAWLFPKETGGKKSKQEVLASILLRPSPRFLYMPRETVRGVPSHVTALQWYQGAYAAMVEEEEFEFRVAGTSRGLKDSLKRGKVLGLEFGLQSHFLFDPEKAEDPLMPRGQYAPLFVSPSMEWAMPAGTINTERQLSLDFAWKAPMGKVTSKKERDALDGLWLYPPREMKGVSPLDETPIFRGELEAEKARLDIFQDLAKRLDPPLSRMKPGDGAEFFRLGLEDGFPPQDLLGALDFKEISKERSAFGRFAKIPDRFKFRLKGKDKGLDPRGSKFGPGAMAARYSLPFNELLFDDAESMQDEKRSRRPKFLADRIMHSSPGQHLIFSKPRFESDYRLFGDLTLYAPGLQTRWADLAATLEREAKAEKPMPVGAIEDGARRLIEEARAGGWETITVIGEDGAPFQVTCNGRGHFQYERTLSTGLQEEVIGGEDYLWHMYPEIGLAGRRPNSRFHFDEISSLVPWMLPPVEELARGADVKLVKEGVVAVVPRLPSRSPSPPAPLPRSGGEGGKKEAAADKEQEPTAYHLHLVFEKGRLVERRVVESPSGKVLLRYTYDAAGTCKVLNGHDQVLTEARLARTAAREPVLTPDTEKLLVIRFPVRTAASLFTQAKATRDQYHKMSKALAEDIFVADCWEGSNWGSLELFGERFHSQGDRRLGFYVLLNSIRRTYNRDQLYTFQHGITTEFDVAKEHPESALALYLEYNRVMLTSPNPVPYVGRLPGPKHGFLNRLSSYRDLVTMWNTGQVGTVTTLEFQANSNRTMRELKDCPELVWAWAVQDAVQRSGRWTSEVHQGLAQVQKDLGEEMGLLYSGRYQHASSLFAAGQKAEAKKLFLALYEEAFATGHLPPIDGDFRQALNSENAEGEIAFFPRFLRERHAQLLKERRPLSALMLTWQAHQMGERALAGEFFLATMDSVDEKNRNLMRLAGLEVLWHTGQHAYADAVLQKVLEDPVLKEQAFVWRIAAHFAERRGLLAKAVAATEKAQDLEFKDLPEIINLEAVRQDYRGLLNQYLQMANAFTITEAAAPKELAAKVVKVADRWRSLDPDNLDVPGQAARILQMLGAKDLAWDYLTTPIGMKPGEAEPWVRLAEQLKEEAQFELADLAYVAAFQADATNAQVLWDRAQNLQAMGRMEEARQVYRRIAAGDWVPRHRGIQEQAKAMR